MKIINISVTVIILYTLIISIIISINNNIITETSEGEKP